MKIPLRYQLSEYDCGPTSLLNGISFLFQREEIPPEVIRNIMLYCLDCYGDDGVSGKSGTSRMAMMFLSGWLDGFGKVGRLPVSSRYLSGPAVSISESSDICDALRRGGAAVVRLLFEEWHYVLLTGLTADGSVELFDPYYEQLPLPDPDIRTTDSEPFRYNRIVPPRCFNREEGLYALGPADIREAVLLFNQTTELTPEKSIEYFI